MNQPTPSTFDDPLDALEHVVADPVRCWQAKSATFYGPQATFQCAAEKCDDKRSADRFLALLPKIDSLLPASDVWKRIRQLALLRLGQCDLNQLLPLLGASATSGTDSLRPPLEELDSDFFQAARDRLGFTKDPKQWTAADWRLLGFCQDALGMAPLPTERTPIFLASESPTRIDGRVLWLVAERLPGPPGLVTPHWWRLGLVPLGATYELATAIDTSFAEVIRYLPRSGDQFRWWLELHPGGGGWHDQVGEADSVQVAAACVARALKPRDGTPPEEEAAERRAARLDPKAGVSATLLGGPPETRLEDRRIGEVGFLGTKIDRAEAAKILTFVVAQGSAVPAGPSASIQVQKVETFEDAYEALLSSATPIQRYKQKVVGEWDARRADTPTHQDFIDAARKSDRKR